MADMFAKGSGQNRGPSIDFSYQVSVHFANRFQWRKLKFEKLTDDYSRRKLSEGKKVCSM